MTSQEKKFYLFTGCALAALVAFAYTTEGIRLIGALGIGDHAPRNPHAYCLDKRYRNSGFCLDRKQQAREDWRGIVNNSASKTKTTFSLRGRN